MRPAFAAKVARCVDLFCKPPWSNVKAGKYAAMLPLAAVEVSQQQWQARLLSPLYHWHEPSIHRVA